MFCTRARSCARADDAKSCAVGMRNAKPENHLKGESTIIDYHAPFDQGLSLAPTYTARVTLLEI